LLYLSSASVGGDDEGLQQGLGLRDLGQRHGRDAGQRLPLQPSGPDSRQAAAELGGGPLSHVQLAQTGGKGLLLFLLLLLFPQEFNYILLGSTSLLVIPFLPVCKERK
jgi:hypothetical protein